MKKKYIGTIAVCLAIACAGTFAVAHAFTDSTPKILGTTETVMGKDVMAAGSMKLVYLDEPAATDHLIYNLPPVAENDGSIYYLKKGFTNGYSVLVYPTSGENIDANLDLEWVLDQSGEYIGLIADASHNTWWVVQNGFSGYDPQ